MKRLGIWLARLGMLLLALLSGASAEEICVEIITPTEEMGVEEGNRLSVRVEGEGIDRIELYFIWEDGEYTMPVVQEGKLLEGDFAFEPTSRRMTVRAVGIRETEEGEQQTVEDTVTLKTPRETLMDSMILQAWKDSENNSKNFLRAHESSDPGMCKNFVMRMFETFRDGYFMESNPDVAMEMPLNQSVEGCKPYRYCVEWRALSREEGNCFEEAARFRYDESLSEEENREKAYAFFREVQRGDCLQMAGVCEDFNSAHTLIFISDYDPETEMFHWTDCNMKGQRIDGERYGFVLYDTQRDIHWLTDAVCRQERGATLYRLTEDIARK